jgi:hypothetical protein
MDGNGPQIQYLIEVAPSGYLVRRLRDGRTVEFVVELLETGDLQARTRDDTIRARGETFSALRSNASAAVRDSLGDVLPVALVVQGGAVAP